MSLTIHTHQAMGHKRGVQFGLPLSAVHPPQQVSGTLTARLTEDQDRGAGRVLRRDVLLRVSSAQEPRRGPFRSLASSNPVSNLTLSCQLLLAPHPRLAPNSGAPISRFLPAPVRRRHPHHPSCPSRSAGLVAGCCWCAPPLDALGWGPASPRRLTTAPRRRPARNFFDGSRPSRVA